MNLTLNGIELSVPETTLAQLVRERLQADVVQTSALPTLPTIGTPCGGGIYAGVTIHNGTPAGLVLLPSQAADVNWEAAKRWAAEKGGVLPSRFDMLVLLQNQRSEFEKECYWTADAYESGESYAWSQSFRHGFQYYGHIGYSLMVRAVRRVPI